MIYLGEGEQNFIKYTLLNRGVNFLQLGCCVCVLYDHVTTLDLEVELVWNRPKWSAVQILFLINRYLGDALQFASIYVLLHHAFTGKDDLSVQFLFFAPHLVIMPPLPSRLPLDVWCKPPKVVFSLTKYYFLGLSFGKAHGLLLVVVLCSMQGIMVYRISSIYNHERRIIIILSAAFGLEVGILVMLQVLTYKFPAPILDPVPGVSLCTHNTFPRWFWTIWLPFLLYELLMFGLTLNVGLKYQRVMTPRGRHSLAYILFRDSILFPLLAAAVCIINIITWTSLPHSAIQMSVSLAAFLPCVLGCRLILNLREAYYLPFEEEATSTNEKCAQRRPPSRSRVHSYIHTTP